MKALRLKSMLKKTSDWGIKNKGTCIQNNGDYGFEDNWPFVYKQLSCLKYLFRKLYLYESNETRKAIDISKNSFQTESAFTRKECKDIDEYFDKNSNSHIINESKEKTALISNHIMILGFKPGVEYIIQSVRSISDAPICILATDVHCHAIRRMIELQENCFHFVGQPYEISCLTNSNIEKCQFCIVVSEREETDIIKDSNAVLISNLLEEWFPNVKFCVELTCKESIQMIENNVFKYNCGEISNMFSISYMSNKIVDTTLLYKLISYLAIDPLRIKFLDLILKNEFDKTTIHAMKINSQYDQKTFGEYREEMLNQSPFKMLCIGVYSRQIEHEINNKVMDFLTEYQCYDDNDSNSESFNPSYSSSLSANDIDQNLISTKQRESVFRRTSKEEIQKSLTKQMRVFSMMPPDEFVLKTGDITYCIGYIPAQAIEKYIKQSSTKEEKFKNDQRNSIPIGISKF